MPLSTTLIAQFWIWLRGDAGAPFNQAIEYTPLAMHKSLHNSGGVNTATAMIRGHLVSDGTQIPPPRSEVGQECKRLDIFNLLDQGQEDFGGEGSIVVWRRMVAAVDRYNRKVAATRAGSEQTLYAVCELLYWLLMYHPFVGGNSRVMTMLLHRELSAHGFHPVLMFNTDGMWLRVGNSLADLVLLVREGLLAWEYAVAEQQKHITKAAAAADRNASTAMPLLASPWVANLTMKAQHVAQFPNRQRCNNVDRWSSRQDIIDGNLCGNQDASSYATARCK